MHSCLLPAAICSTSHSQITAVSRIIIVYFRKHVLSQGSLLVVRFIYSTGQRVNSIHLFFIVVIRPLIGCSPPLVQWLPQGPGAGSGVQCAETRRVVFGGPWDRRPRPGGVQGHRRQQAAVAGQDCAAGGRLCF